MNIVQFTAEQVQVGFSIACLGYGGRPNVQTEFFPLITLFFSFR
ncbi:MAG: hypothetical protein RJR37_00635 [Peptococcaceae bacterium MAG4]|nr:hypothetical protein [Peptococcaceae bacterium MAG4]